MSAYYNEFDQKAAAWLRELIRRKLIAPGDVDERSIEDVVPSDLRGYRQHHFFAGIGGWSYALRLAGWPDDKPVWTGSCPCQPFSSAGRRAGFADERHLWPAWFHLIRQYGPAVVLGEQVASKDGLGWLDLVCADLEGAGYAFGAADLCAAGVGAPHIRQRLWFVADANLSNDHRWASVWEQSLRFERGSIGVLGNTDDTRPQGHRRLVGINGSQGREVAQRHESAHGFWSEADLVACSDGKARPVEPGTFPLAHGVPARMVRLRGYGNAINPEVAAQFIQAAIECGVGAEPQRQQAAA